MPSNTHEQQEQSSHIISDMHDWPIVQLSKERNEFIQQVINTSIGKVIEQTNGSIKEEIARTLYSEKIRFTEHHWNIDPKDEKYFWDEIKELLLKFPPKANNNDVAEHEEKIITKIVDRYAKEIAGKKFNIPLYNFSQRVLPIVFSRLLNAALGESFKAKLKGEQFSIRDKIHFTGDIDSLKNLARKGTLVMLPTHFSNLDSVVIGWAIQAIGLPAFLYGAGLNLFGIGVYSYFMNRLGAYKIDRRKKNLLYLETLKTYSTLALHRGCHSLFFPAGSRSRSGSIAPKLKLGLLGTAMDAQFMNFQNATEIKNAKKIFIVPVVINYHFVLEAPFLIDEYLKTTGKEQYLIDESDKFSTSYEIVKILLKFLTASSDFTLSFGKGMDIFGNDVDEDGNSLDTHGREIDISKYFISNGELKQDRQRDAEYVKMLNKKIVERYYQENTVLSSHLVAFAAFELLKKQHSRLDIYGILRLTQNELLIPFEQLITAIEKLKEELMRISAHGKIKLSPAISMKAEVLIMDGIRNVGVYHPKKVLMKNKAGDITTKDIKLLYYYHNRLEGYELERCI